MRSSSPHPPRPPTAPTQVLQQSPAKAAVYGTVEAGGTGVTITVAGGSASGMASYTVPATLKSGEWKALLKPAAAGGSYTITAKCTGCKNATDAVLTDVTFGDVWYCGGQVMPPPLSPPPPRSAALKNLGS